MNGGHVLQLLGLVLLLLGGAGIAFQLSGAGTPVMWLGSIGPIVMGIAMLILGRSLQRER